MKIKTRKYGQIDAKVQTMLNRVYYNNNSGVVTSDERYVKDEDSNKTLIFSGTVLLQGYMVKGRWELPFTPTPTLRDIYLICDFDNDTTYLSFDDVINTGDPLTQTGVLSCRALQLNDNYIYWNIRATHTEQDFNPIITPIDLKSYLNTTNFNVSSSTAYAYKIHPNIVKINFSLTHARDTTTNSVLVFGGSSIPGLPTNLRPTIICSSFGFNSKYNKLFEIRTRDEGVITMYTYADRTLNNSTTTGTIYLYRGAV